MIHYIPTIDNMTELMRDIEKEIYFKVVKSKEMTEEHPPKFILVNKDEINLLEHNRIFIDGFKYHYYL